MKNLTLTGNSVIHFRYRLSQDIENTQEWEVK